jgi:hypothetical protein
MEKNQWHVSLGGHIVPHVLNIIKRHTYIVEFEMYPMMSSSNRCIFQSWIFVFQFTWPFFQIWSITFKDIFSIFLLNASDTAKMEMNELKENKINMCIFVKIFFIIFYEIVTIVWSFIHDQPIKCNQDVKSKDYKM